MKIYNLLFLALSLIFMNAFEAKSQEEIEAKEQKVSLEVGTDLKNRYVWRGMNFGTSPVIQPWLEVSCGGFAFGSWSSYSFAKEPYQEVDLYLSYNQSYFTLTINNYFSPVDSIGIGNSYFDWDQKTTGHILETQLDIADIPNLPLSFVCGVMFYGADLDENGDNCYSSYFELDYNFSVGKTSASAFIGATPSSGFYSDDFNVVNVGIKAAKEIPVTDKFSLPITSSVAINPSTENIFFTFGISF